MCCEILTLFSKSVLPFQIKKTVYCKITLPLSGIPVCQDFKDTDTNLHSYCIIGSAGYIIISMSKSHMEVWCLGTRGWNY